MNKRNVRMNGQFVFAICNKSTRTNYINIMEQFRDEFPGTRSSDLYFSDGLIDGIIDEELMDRSIQLDLYYILEKAVAAESMYNVCQGPVMGIVLDGEKAKFKVSIHQGGLYEPERWKKVLDFIEPILLKGTCINFFSSDSGHHWRIISEEDGSWELQEGEITFR